MISNGPAVRDCENRIDEAKTVNRPASETQRSLSPATPLWSTRQHHDDSYFSLGEAC